MIILSDLHMGAGDAADDFSGEDCQADIDLLDDIEMWKEAGEKIVLAGDILDLWQAEYWKVLQAHGAAVQALFSAAEAYVVGNHDSDALGKKLYGLEGLPSLVVDGLWIEHGHAHDPVVGRFPLLARAGCWLGGLAERVIHRDVDVLAERVARWFSRTGRHGGNARYLMTMADAAVRHDCTRAVFGHSHQFMQFSKVPIGDMQIANSGTWTGGRRDFVQIQT